MTKKFDKQMEENIKNYDKLIVTLEDFIQAVRQMPAMYIGHKGNKGFITMFREVFQNATDEVIKKKSPADRIFIIFDERSLEITVEDNGRGIPFDDIIRIMTSEHTSSNYEKEDGEFPSGMHGVGAKVTNALSTRFTVKSYILGKAKQVNFIEGYPESDPIDIPNEGKQGTIVSFIPSLDMMGNIDVDHKEILSLINKIHPLLPLNTPINFTYITMDGKSHSTQLINEDGIISLLINKTQEPLIPPIYLSNFGGKMVAEVMFTYGLEEGLSEDISSYANLCPTKDGTHIDGFIDGLTKFFRDYMNKIYLNGNKKIYVNNNDIRSGLKAVVSVKHIRPEFTGQAKEHFDNADMQDFIRITTSKGLEEWSKVNPKDLAKVAKFLKDMAETRIKSDDIKIKLTNNYKASALNPNLPEKYSKPAGKRGDKLELIIAEGDSAGDQAKEARDKRTQGVLPIRGKLPNALSTPKIKFLNNEEISGIITIIGAGYGKNCDVSKCIFDKIIIGSDADPDGDHISTLILIFFMVYLRPLLEAGKLYKSTPPLFGIKERNKTRFFSTKYDLIKEINKDFAKNNTIIDSKGKKLSVSDISDLFFRNGDYDYYLDNIANRYSVEPSLLEFVLLNKDLSFSKLESIVRKNYKYVMDFIKIKNTIEIKVLIEDKINTLFLNDKLLYESKEILYGINRINGGNIYYNFNSNIISLYKLISLFNKYIPSNLQRYKGLGEMNEDQLSISTIHPNKDRLLLQYTFESANDEIETIKRLQSNKYDLIKDIKVTRQDLL